LLWIDPVVTSSSGVQEIITRTVAIKTTKRRMNPPCQLMLNMLAPRRAPLPGAALRVVAKDCTGPVILASPHRDPAKA
jgi:hypothetical protein